MERKRPPYDSLVAGVAVLLVGILSEAASRPYQPITFVPGLAFVPLGLGLAVAVLQNKFFWPGVAAFVVGLGWCLMQITLAATSALPAALFFAAFALCRFGLVAASD